MAGPHLLHPQLGLTQKQLQPELLSLGWLLLCLLCQHLARGLQCCLALLLVLVVLVLVMLVLVMLLLLVRLVVLLVLRLLLLVVLLLPLLHPSQQHPLLATGLQGIKVTTAVLA